MASPTHTHNARARVAFKIAVKPCGERDTPPTSQFSECSGARVTPTRYMDVRQSLRGRTYPHEPRHRSACHIPHSAPSGERRARSSTSICAGLGARSALAAHVTPPRYLGVRQLLQHTPTSRPRGSDAYPTSQTPIRGMALPYSTFCGLRRAAGTFQHDRRARGALAARVAPPRYLGVRQSPQHTPNLQAARRATHILHPRRPSVALQWERAPRRFDFWASANRFVGGVRAVFKLHSPRRRAVRIL